MYKYIAVTNSTIEKCTALLRIAPDGVIEQYKGEQWQAASSGMSGIYSGDVECETITKEQANEIIQRWASVDNKGV